jgi:GT2 family glycosyltransferase
MLSIVVVTHSRLDLLAPCLDSLGPARERVDGETEVIVVDSGSEGDVAEVLAAHAPDARLVRLAENVGFPAAADEGIRASRGEWVATLNDDTTVVPEALGEMLKAGSSAEEVGSVAAQMVFASDRATINSAGIDLDRLAVSTDRRLGAPADPPGAEPHEVFGACGGAALYRRSMLEAVGGFDRSYFAFLDDVDLAWRARMQGWRCLYAPAAVVVHHHSATLVNRSFTQYYWGGRNRVRTLAKNADRGLLLRYGALMVAYDAAYVLYALLRDRTVAPLRGRVAGIRDWGSYRRRGRDLRRPLTLSRPRGLRAALGRRSVWENRSSFGDARLPGDSAG